MNWLRGKPVIGLSGAVGLALTGLTDHSLYSGNRRRFEILLVLLCLLVRWVERKHRAGFFSRFMGRRPPCDRSVRRKVAGMNAPLMRSLGRPVPPLELVQDEESR